MHAWELAHEVERWIAEGQLRTGQEMPSARLLAEQFGVSRATVREAFRTLAARGVLELRQGARARIVHLETDATLETLTTLVGARDQVLPQRRWAVRGLLALTRTVTVDLLARACESTPVDGHAEVHGLLWHLNSRARQEAESDLLHHATFELLRAAARVLDDEGTLLLVTSLERAWLRLYALLEPLLHFDAVLPWAEAAERLVAERASAQLRETVPRLLAVRDAPLLAKLAPPPQAIPKAPEPDDAADDDWEDEHGA